MYTDCGTDNLELASLPTTTPDERKKLLSFVVCGGGPTGVEFAAELADMMAEDVLKYVGFPKGFRVSSHLLISGVTSIPRSYPVKLR